MQFLMMLLLSPSPPFTPPSPLHMLSQDRQGLETFITAPIVITAFIAALFGGKMQHFPLRYKRNFYYYFAFQALFLRLSLKDLQL